MVDFEGVNMSNSMTYRPTGTIAQRPSQRERLSIQTAGKLLGEVVYAIRLTDGTVKIGWTQDLGRRKTYFGSEAQVIGFRRGSLADEQALHTSLAPHRHHGREYYNATPEVLAVVNDMRSAFNLEPLAA